MKKTNKLYRLLRGLLIGVTAWFFTACREDMDSALSAGGNIAYVNFVNSAEALLYGNNEDSLLSNNCVYINDSANVPAYYKGRETYPMTFRYEAEANDYIRQYPRDVSGINPGDLPDRITADVYWLPLEGGDYRFIFTSKNKTYLKTAEEKLEKNTYQVLYLVESPETDSSYTVVNVPIERNERAEGQVTVQFVNLSPDVGEVEVYRVDKNGNEMSVVTAAPLTFGQHTQAEFPTDGTENSYNSLLLRFRYPGGDDLQNIAVPANSGAVYSLLLRGFAKETERRIKKNNENIAAVTVLPNLRCSLLRVFY